MTVYLPAVPGYHHLDVPVGDIVHVTEYVTAAALADPALLDAARFATIGGHQVPVSRVPVETIIGSGEATSVPVERNAVGQATAGPVERNAAREATAGPVERNAAREATAGPVERNAAGEATAGPAGAIAGWDVPYAVAVITHPGGGDLFTDGDDVIRLAGGIAYLPSLHTTDGDFRDQYRWCLERTATLLATAGLDTGALVRTVDYTATATRAEYPRCGRPRRDLLPGPVHPGAAGILVDVPVAPGAQVSLDAVAATGPLTALNPGWARYDTLTYKPAVRAGRNIFLAGFGALDPVSQRAIHSDDLVGQAAFIYRSIETVLTEAGATGENVVHLVEYLTPEAVAGYPRTNFLRAKHFPNAVVTSVVCSALLRPEFLLETVPTAVLG